MAGSLAELIEQIGSENERRKALLSPAASHADDLRTIEDSILRSSMATVGDALRFREIDPGEEGIPDEWVRELGMVEAIRRHRVARLAHLPAKDAPIGLKLAHNVMIGIVKARATERAEPRVANITLVQVTAPPRSYPELDVTPTQELEAKR